MVKQLLGSRKTTSAVLELIATIRAGRMPRAQEQEQEKKSRNRDQMWRLEEKRLEGCEDEEEGRRETGGEECEEEEETRGG